MAVFTWEGVTDMSIDLSEIVLNVTGEVKLTKGWVLKAVLPILREITNQEIDVTGHGLMSRKGDYYTVDTFLDALSRIVQEEDMEEKK